ncbi:hypothetical protein B0H21DRAFT_753161, partial [Amylocystis lapponica]
MNLVPQIPNSVRGKSGKWKPFKMFFYNTGGQPVLLKEVLEALPEGPLWNEPVRSKMSVYIDWPGYEPWDKQGHFVSAKEKLTKMRLLLYIAKMVQKFWKEHGKRICSKPEWYIGVKIQFGHLVLDGVERVSIGGLQPILGILGQQL